MNIGILLIGYMRPRHLECVLESLKKQDLLEKTHLWIDGSGGRSEHASLNHKSIAIGEAYDTKELRVHNGHYGIEKIMLDGLSFMAEEYDAFIVLEDDCFPLKGFYDVFCKQLKQIDKEENIFSVYGHHFRVDGEGKTFSRFQGWGWATTSNKIKTLLPDLKKLFLMDEESYLSYVQSEIDEDVRKALDVTPGRNVLQTLDRMFSWDSCLSLLCTINHFSHAKTEPQVIVNIGIDRRSGHFNRDLNLYRNPPFNMVSIDEVWELYDSDMSEYTVPTRLSIENALHSIKKAISR